MLFVELIWKNLRERPTRSLLTVSGLAIAVAAIVVLWTAAWGYADSSRKYYAQRGADIVIVRAGVSNRFTSRMPEDLKQLIASVPDVARVDGTLTEMVSLGDAKVIGIPLRGYEPNSPALEGLEMSSGRKLNADDRGAVLLGASLAESLGKHAGDKMEIEATPFEIAGIYLAGNPFDSNGIVAPLVDVQKLMDRPGVISEFQVRVDPSSRNQTGLQEICRNIEALRNDREQPLGLKAQPTNSFINSASEAKLGGAMAWATTTIVLALSLMGMLNTMAMSVLDRTRELGILRAIGWTRGRIVRMILGESCTLSLASATLGLLAAWCVVRLLASWSRTNLIVPPSLSSTAIGLGIAAAIATGIVGALYPAAHAAHVPPIESLRHE
jgi:putative ABC transport system permease protein